MKEHLIDRIKINVKGGDGGSGCISFRREKYVPLGGPDGGNGGKGGSVYLQADSQVMDFVPFKFKVHFRATRGSHGKGSLKDGKMGEDFFIKVPRGTIVYDADTNLPLADIVEEGERFLAARGGRGGRGNTEFKTAFKRAPHFSEKGEEGEDRWLLLELKLLADVGIIGFPNAGKSTLLSRVSNATPRIAPYPFTTLSPNLGVVTHKGGETAIFADVPGLIEGVGLGLTFLRHIERTMLLLHMIDTSEIDTALPFDHYEKLRNELRLYNPTLVERPEIVVFNKLDLPGQQEKVDVLKYSYHQIGISPFFISAMVDSHLNELREVLFDRLREIPPPRLDLVIPEPEKEEPFTIEKVEDYYVVKGKTVEKILARLDMDNEQAVDYFQQRLRSLGVESALMRIGARRGDFVVIGDDEFEFDPDEMGIRGHKKRKHQ